MPGILKTSKICYDCKKKSRDCLKLQKTQKKEKKIDRFYCHKIRMYQFSGNTQAYIRRVIKMSSDKIIGDKDQNKTYFNFIFQETKQRVISCFCSNYVRTYKLRSSFFTKFTLIKIYQNGKISTWLRKLSA